ncbi:DUF4435 domain-containing protein [Nostoc sp. ATCC 53789]|uniref:DUF4435 domain-containing protein n=1 Tax=Nostoc sp. ATCC 53789 TaxID=76335 RepID=UPI000DED213F|nr:DUF4435 domain-containing protein [Nostoc sp. ATCC 53789]QHG20713.1 DUF4435 domain-containing protein [Nostoc sp. ATCC 53789]RCJ15465.1 hypothetical protein A6V25_32525 [Nostoc sp. ATCC 53789]
MFSRTSSGIRNTHLFYSGFYLVIVEGTSDCPFWGKFFPSEINGYKLKLKPVGGKAEVQNYINEILTNESKFVVALDSDYRYFLGRLHENPRIIETKYHSIENLLLCSSTITSIIRNLSHNVEYEDSTVIQWLEYFDQTTYGLMLADILIEKNNLGKQCVGDNCFPFLLKKHNPIFDILRISDFVTTLNLPQNELNEIDRIMKEYKPRQHIRGHFFFSAVLCFISHEVKKIRNKSVSISNDSFYALSVSLCECCLETDTIFKNIQTQALLAAKEVTELLSQAT